MKGFRDLPTERQVCILLGRQIRSGLSSSELAHGVRPQISPQAMAKVLADLRLHGQVTISGTARARRYLLAGGYIRRSAIRSLTIHELIPAVIMKNPKVLERAKARLAALQRKHGAGNRYYDQWDGLLLGPRDRLFRMMTEDSEFASDLRRMSPFEGVFPRREMDRFLRMFLAL